MVLREKFIALSTYITEQKRPQINDINFHCKKLENKANSTQKQANEKNSKGKKSIK